MKYIETFGQENPTTITAGVDLAINYLKVERVIECERLLGKLIPIATRVHGKDHRQTRKAVSILRQAKVRYVTVNHHLQWQSFQALRYEDDGARCILQGPIESPRNIKEEQIISVETLCLKMVPFCCISQIHRLYVSDSRLLSILMVPLEN